MILGRYIADGVVHVGARLDAAHVLELDGVLDPPLPAAEPDPMTTLIKQWAIASPRASALAACAPEKLVRPLADVRLIAPLAPPRMRNFSVYEGHVRGAFEAGVEVRAGKIVAGALRRTGILRPPRHWYRRPAYYKGNHLSVIGPYDDVSAPAYTRQLDYELELAVVIGAAGRDIEESDAPGHVFGYTLLDDLSARDVLVGELFSGMGPAKGKDFDTGNVLGPWLATRDEVPDPRALTGEVRVNSRLRATCTTSDMRHGVPAMVAEASRGESLAVGEVLGTGCCTGGSGLEQLRFLRRGDLVELTLGPFGTQRNRVVC
ncbi:fumarylacetoacetate hydrolase family protein [Tsukamurella sp. 8F]|uniref:fumarylacetoacetate hydrolase family protein n=1 Tax=unclassified Tsukamurella TaxID=2633480 RepID=UPI0023B9CE86|nr:MULTISPECIES: fumarylacetoacetate hydrolase family protein [unclassified Tsukamurella]MDF0531726.1 fumarylacetoacetate hydrolase family protein [Tsukamurella sp. 8J]MDF0588972.1 fumarylacetoacetate hydrolase family protein [Tsukamurella sp. 8F]